MSEQIIKGKAPAGAPDKRAMIDRLTYLRTLMLKKQPFFGELLMRMDFALARCETACTDMRRIVFDPDFMNRLSDKELSFVLMHEVMHCVLKHPERGKGKLHLLFNIACDIVVNSNILKCMGETDIIVDGEPAIHLTPSGLEGCNFSAEEVYYELLKNPQIPVRKPGGGMSSDSPEDYDTLDNHDVWELISVSQSDEDRFESEIETILAKGYGESVFPQSVRKLLEERALEAKLRWKELLRDFVNSYVYYTDYSFAPPDRRFVDSPYMLPAENTYEREAMQDIWFCVDTSGSISDKQLTRLYTEVMNVINEINGCRGMISFFDAGITEPVEFSSEEDFNGITPAGGGGTSFQVIFDYMAEYMSDKLPNALVILTDGCAPEVDERCAMSVPVLWIIIDMPKITMSWGRTVHCSTE